MRCSSLLVAAVALLLGGCDRVSSRYATLADARNDRLFERGWLPDILPVSAHQIHVSSDLDTNQSEGEFSFDPSDFTSFAARLQPVGESFEYSAGAYTWIFSCDSARGHCRYTMRKKT
jgi:hypothetical protein